MATHSRILAWRIPWTEEPGSVRSQRVRHNWNNLAAAAYTHTHTHTYIKQANKWRRESSAYNGMSVEGRRNDRNREPLLGNHHTGGWPEGSHWWRLGLVGTEYWCGLLTISSPVTKGKWKLGVEKHLSWWDSWHLLSAQHHFYRIPAEKTRPESGQEKVSDRPRAGPPYRMKDQYTFHSRSWKRGKDWRAIPDQDTGGSSLAVQWLRLHPPNTEGLGLIPSQGKRSFKSQPKIPHATTKDPAQPDNK